MFNVPRGLSWLVVLEKISKTLGITRRILPLYAEIKPMLQKVPLVVNKMKDISYGIKNNYYKQRERLIEMSPSEKPTNKQNSPTFFQ